MPIYALGDKRPSINDVNHLFIAPDAMVIGDCRLSADVSIWFGAVLRGDNEPIIVGARSNIQDGAVLHTDPGFPIDIGEDCTIGHRAIIHGAIIGAGSLIGMGSTILNGARIGRGSLVGANALVTEGKEFPDHSLIIGAPAKLVRILDEESIAMLRRSADNYVKNGRRFAKDLNRID